MYQELLQSTLNKDILQWGPGVTLHVTVRAAPAAVSKVGAVGLQLFSIVFLTGLAMQQSCGLVWHHHQRDMDAAGTAEVHTGLSASSAELTRAVLVVRYRWMQALLIGCSCLSC